MEKPTICSEIVLCRSFFNAMKTIAKQEIKLKKSSKHSKQLSKLKKEFLEYYSKLPIQRLAADRIGKDEDTITNWKKKDKRFSDVLGTAKSEWVLENVGKVKSAEWLLERVMNEYFGEKKEVDNNTNPELEAALDRMRKWFPN